MQYPDHHLTAALMERRLDAAQPTIARSHAVRQRLTAWLTNRGRRLATRVERVAQLPPPRPSRLKHS